MLLVLEVENYQRILPKNARTVLWVGVCVVAFAVCCLLVHVSNKTVHHFRAVDKF